MKKISRTQPFRFALLASSATAMLLMASGAAAQTSDAADEEEDVIIVRGVKSSLESARDKKQDASQILDAIDAEDIGKLPDTNVAESLQRITGVQINRELGEGSEISVRGFSQNRIEINGQTQVGAGATSGVSFQTLPSEAFSSLEVIKTPSADDVEGGIGAIIRLNTRKPLDRKKLIVAGGLSGSYADRAEEWAPQANILLSNAWETKNGYFGASINYTRNDRKLRQDFLDVRGWDAVNGFERDLDGDGIIGEAIERDEEGIITNLQDGAFVPLQTRLRIRNQDRKLESVTSALQWQVSDRTEIYADLTYSENRADDTQFQYTSAFNSAIRNDRDNPGSRIREVYQQPDNAVISDDQTVLSAFLGQIRSNGTAQRGVNLNISGNSAPNDSEVYTWDVGLKQELEPGWDVEVNYAEGHGESFNQQIFTTSGVAFSEWPFYFFDFGGETDVPTIVPLLREVDGQAVTEFTDETRVDLLDLSTYSLGTPLYQDQVLSNEDKSFTVDFDKDADIGLIKSLEFGLRWGYQQGQRTRFRGDDDETNPGLSDRTFEDLDAAFPGLIVRQPFDDILNGATGDFPQDWFSINPAYLRANSAQLRADGEIISEEDLGWSYDVSRDTMAYYLKANVEGTLPFTRIPYSGNFGVRYVQTDADIFGYTDDGEDVSPFNARKKYDNFLPSGNLAFVLYDDLFLRLGAAKTIARPELDDIAPVRRIQFFADAGNGGNPQLQPEEVTQFDLSLEHYFGDANLLSFAYFYKDFSERIEDGVLNECIRLRENDTDNSPGDDGCRPGENLIRLSVPDNVGEAKVNGFELGYQQTFDFLPTPLDGLGLIANYTYIDIDGGGSISATGLSLPVQDLSENSYNIVAFYEKYGFQARAAYNWRDEFYDERTSTNQASFAEPYGQLDVSASYDITKNITVTFEGLNILNEEEIRYQEIRERLIAYRVNDTRFVGGVRFRF